MKHELIDDIWKLFLGINYTFHSALFCVSQPVLDILFKFPKALELIHKGGSKEIMMNYHHIKVENIALKKAQLHACRQQSDARKYVHKALPAQLKCRMSLD